MANKIEKKNFVIVYELGDNKVQQMFQVIARNGEEAVEKLAEMWKGWNVTVVKVSEPQDFTYDFADDSEGKLGKALNEEPFNLEEVIKNGTASKVLKGFDSIVDIDKWAEKNGRKTKNDKWHDDHKNNKGMVW